MAVIMVMVMVTMVWHLHAFIVTSGYVHEAWMLTG